MTPTEIFQRAIPPDKPDAADWCPEHVRLPGSARTERFDLSVTPWALEPLSQVNSETTRIVTHIKPIQSGGSTIGEALMLYWIKFGRGVFQFNWQDNDRSKHRWKTRLERTMRACAPVGAMIDALPRNAFNICSVDFPTCYLQVQGAFNSDNLDSDTVPFQLNEEVHNWPPGHLAKARGRQTAVWNSFAFDISNASNFGDQLHQSFDAGTQQEWQVKCPGCGKFHTMRTRWDDRRPELGGLRYDSEGCRMSDGRYDYGKLEGTIRYQMPCAHVVANRTPDRRALSMSGRYSDPRAGAHPRHRSYIMDGVACDFVSWLTLIQEKHAALRARRLGDPEPWRRYITERECRFYDPSDVPIAGKIILSAGVKDRNGLPGRAVRFAALDRQQGSIREGELPHWWVVIRDVDKDGNSLLVFEGKCHDDLDVVDVLKRHDVQPHHVVADSGDDTTHVYFFCFRHGFHAIKGSKVASFAHDDGNDGISQKIFGVEKPLHTMLPGDHAPKYDYVNGAPDPREPMFWMYSKHGIAERLHWIRAGGALKHEVPSDVSEDYLSHQEAEELQDHTIPLTGERTKIFVQVKPRNDLLVCERYCAMLMDMGGFIGEAK